MQLPYLKIIPIEQVLLHETLDRHRLEPMIETLQRDNQLRNPPIVAALPETSQFVVLDGANRVTAMTRMGFPHILAQVVDYLEDGVDLQVWYHVVCGVKKPCLGDLLQEIDGLQMERADLLTARAALARREVIVYLVCPDKSVILVSGGHSFGERVQLLNALVDVYRGQAMIHRTDTDLLDQVFPFYDDVSGIIVFPRYTPVEIMALVREGYFLPTGITRHVIPGRALHINLPLSILADREQSLDDKNRWLDRWLKERLSGRGVRFYQESTFLFDE